MPDAGELMSGPDRFVDRLKQMPELEDIATISNWEGWRIPGDRSGYRFTLGIAVATIDTRVYDASASAQINTMVPRSISTTWCSRAIRCSRRISRAS